MKRLNLLMLTLIVFPLSSVAHTVITYGYDAAGNRTTRTSSVEVASITESQTSDKLEILELDYSQELLNDMNQFCYALKQYKGNNSGNEFSENFQLENRRKIFLCFVESPEIMTQAINTKQKRI